MIRRPRVSRALSWLRGFASEPRDWRALSVRSTCRSLFDSMRIPCGPQANSIQMSGGSGGGIIGDALRGSSVTETICFCLGDPTLRSICNLLPLGRRPRLVGIGRGFGGSSDAVVFAGRKAPADRSPRTMTRRSGKTEGMGVARVVHREETSISRKIVDQRMVIRLAFCVERRFQLQCAAAFRIGIRFVLNAGKCAWLRRRTMSAGYARG